MSETAEEAKDCEHFISQTKNLRKFVNKIEISFDEDEYSPLVGQFDDAYAEEPISRYPGRFWGMKLNGFGSVSLTKVGSEEITIANQIVASFNLNYISIRVHPIEQKVIFTLAGCGGESNLHGTIHGMNEEDYSRFFFNEFGLEEIRDYIDTGGSLSSSDLLFTPRKIVCDNSVETAGERCP